MKRQSHRTGMMVQCIIASVLAIATGVGIIYVALIPQTREQVYSLTKSDYVLFSEDGEGNLQRYTEENGKFDCGKPDYSGLYCLAVNLEKQLDPPLLRMQTEQGCEAYLDGQPVYSSVIGIDEAYITLPGNYVGKKLTVLFQATSDENCLVAMPEFEISTEIGLAYNGMSRINKDNVMVLLFLVLFIILSAAFLFGLWRGGGDINLSLLIWYSVFGEISVIGSLGSELSGVYPDFIVYMSSGFSLMSTVPLLLFIALQLSFTRKIFVPVLFLHCACTSVYFVLLSMFPFGALIATAQMVARVSLVFACVFLLVCSLFEYKTAPVHLRAFSISGAAMILLIALEIVLYMVAPDIVSGYGVTDDSSLFGVSIGMIQTALVVCITVTVVTKYFLAYLHFYINARSNSLSLKATEQYIGNLKHHNDVIREVKHDINHHISVIRVLLDNGENDRAKQYVDDLADKMDVMNSPNFCAHVLGNYILSYYNEQAGQAGIRFSVKAKLPASVAISDVDISAILKNILENAFEACAKLPEDKRFVNVLIRTENEIVKIECSNTYSGTIIDHGDGPVSTKNDGDPHGYGMRIIRRSCEKYGGCAITHYEKNMFFINAAIPYGSSTESVAK